MLRINRSAILINDQVNKPIRKEARRIFKNLFRDWFQPTPSTALIKMANKPIDWTISLTEAPKARPMIPRSVKLIK